MPRCMTSPMKHIAIAVFAGIVGGGLILLACEAQDAPEAKPEPKASATVEASAKPSAAPSASAKASAKPDEGSGSK